MPAYRAKLSADITTEGHPSVGWNLAWFNDYTPPRFLNLLKQGRDWHCNGMGRHPDGSLVKMWEYPDYDLLDANREVIALPPGETEYFDWFFTSRTGKFPELLGSYTLRWDGGNAGIELEGPGFANYDRPDANVNLATVDIVDYASAANHRLIVTPHDLAGNPPRNFSLVKTQHLAAYDAGEIFAPEWIADMTGKAACFRFMDWAETNGSWQDEWSDRPLPGWKSWAVGNYGCPLEVMIDLCNKLAADPWFCIPHQATDAYVTAMATLVRDTLDPALIPFFELSNEVWNSQFYQSKYAGLQAETEWGLALDTDGRTHWHGKRSGQVMKIVQAVFGSRKNNRVMAWQQGNIPGMEIALTSPAWQSNDPGSYDPPHLYHNYLSCTHYFSINHTVDAQAIHDALQIGQSEAAQVILDRTAADVPNTINNLKNLKLLADRYGYDGVVTYEGNQHNNAPNAINTILYEGPSNNRVPIAGFVTAINEANYSQEMAAMHVDVLDGIKPYVETICMYNDMWPVSNNGCWGIRTFAGDMNPINTAVQAWQAANPRWWIRD